LFKNFSGNLVEATEKGLVLKPPPKAAEPVSVRRPSGVQLPPSAELRTSASADSVEESSREVWQQGKDDDIPPDDDFGDFQAAD
jgi:hypothetical protein